MPQIGLTMSDFAGIEITVLWTHELESASEHCHAFWKAFADKSTDPVRLAKLGLLAAQTAHVALHTIAENPGSHIAVFNGKDARFVPREIHVAAPSPKKNRPTKASPPKMDTPTA